LWLRERIPWMGEHSGYDVLFSFIETICPHPFYSAWVDRHGSPLDGLLRVLLYPIIRHGRINRSMTTQYTEAIALAELKACWKTIYHKCNLLHVTLMERNLGLLSKWKKKLGVRLVCTSHHPPAMWRMIHRRPQIVSDMDALITVSSESAEYFEQYLPGRVHLIRHGVDTDFFTPRVDDTTPEPGNPHCLFGGIWWRDVDTLSEVVDKVLAQKPNVQFDMILPSKKQYQGDMDLQRIASHSQVSWHENLSDEGLRDIYRKASILVLPLVDCTANNVLLEAMACGLPVVSNDVGGVRDYTTDAFADLLPVGDAAGMTEAVLRLLDDGKERRKRGSAARSFTEENLNLREIGAQMLGVYEKINQ
jgi:glycosyltransferase involved in cell wall biosynthesis